MAKAVRNQKDLPMPAQRESLDLADTFTGLDIEKLKQGFVPQQMEDKWSIFFEDDWLYLHRSWTGHCIFALRFQKSPAGIHIVESWANRDQEQYQGGKKDFDQKLVRYLIATLLLGQDVPFPER